MAIFNSYVVYQRVTIGFMMIYGRFIYFDRANQPNKAGHPAVEGKCQRQPANIWI